MPKDIFIRTVSMTEVERANVQTAADILGVSMNQLAQRALEYALEHRKSLKKEEKLEQKISVSLTDEEVISVEMLAQSLDTQPTKLWRQILRLYIAKITEGNLEDVA